MEDYFERTGAYMSRSGVAKARGMKSTCKKKVCFASTDRAFLLDVLLKVSNANDCFDVKYTTDERGGMVFGSCYFTNESAVGDLWAQYESHPKLWVTVHDDEFCESYRSRIRTY